MLRKLLSLLMLVGQAHAQMLQGYHPVSSGGSAAAVVVWLVPGANILDYQTFSGPRMIPGATNDPVLRFE